MKTALTELLGIEVPVICGAMYPCSNPELVAAVSEAGGIGIIQPLSLVFVHKREFAAGLDELRRLTQKPLGLNVLTESSLGSVYGKRMIEYVDVALAHGIRFFVTALGDPKWVVDRVGPHGGVVFHDVVSAKWADKALTRGVGGLICVNNRAGGHAGAESAESLFKDRSGLGVPLVAAGGVGDGKGFRHMLDLGYAGVQMGTRFIAAKECTAHADYKKAIVDAQEQDIVLTERLTGVPLAVINTPYMQRLGTKAGPIGRLMLKGRKTKHLIRSIYSLQSFFRLKNASMKGATSADAWQAGKSVSAIHEVLSAGDIVRELGAA